MSNSILVPVDRQFSEISPDEESSEYSYFSGFTKNVGWSELFSQDVVVILAEGGAGKTHEMRIQAKKLASQGHFSFFIRIEDLNDADFNCLFEVGSIAEFAEWQQSNKEAWFFLDSVDEAKLKNERDFEKAIKRFGQKINNYKYRAHIIISSRPHIWRSSIEGRLVSEIFPAAQNRNSDNPQQHGSNNEITSTVDSKQNKHKVYQLRPLSLNDTKRFANAYNTPNLPELLGEIERKNLTIFAARPNDLIAILEFWQQNGQISNREELLKHHISRNLDESNENRSNNLNQEKINSGIQLLAAASTLTGKSNIRLDTCHNVEELDCKYILTNWNDSEIKELCSRAILGGIVYDSIRFTNREIKEYLTAKWLHVLLKQTHSRRQIEALFFAEQYGENVIIPRLRPLLPWLILWDEDIRTKALKISPEIAVEGGDISQLPLNVRQGILNGIVDDIVQGKDKRNAQDNLAIARIAQQDLQDDVLNLIQKHKEHGDAIFFLGRLVWQGKLKNCTTELFCIAINPQYKTYARRSAIRAIAAIEPERKFLDAWQQINLAQKQISKDIFIELLSNAQLNANTAALFVESLRRLPTYKEYTFGALKYSIHQFIDTLVIPLDKSQATNIFNLIAQLEVLFNQTPLIERANHKISQQFKWLNGIIQHAIEKLVLDRSEQCFEPQILKLLNLLPVLNQWFPKDYDSYESKLKALIQSWPELNQTLFWQCIKYKIQKKKDKGQKLDTFYLWQARHFYFQVDDLLVERLFAYLLKKQNLEICIPILNLVVDYYCHCDKPISLLENIKDAVVSSDELCMVLARNIKPSIPTQEQIKQERKHQKSKRQFQLRDDIKETQRQKWISELNHDPDKVFSSNQIKLGDITNNQVWLFDEIRGDDMSTHRANGVDWRHLQPEFTEQVAIHYRDFAIRHWRNHTPKLASEGADTSSVPYALLIALQGTEFEANEVLNFPQNLSASEASHLSRYIFCEINGFPSWLEAMFKYFPIQTIQAIETELYYELAQNKYKVAHDLVYHAPWLHQAIAPSLYTWFGRKVVTGATLRYLIRLLYSGGIAESQLTTLAKAKIRAEQDDNDLALYYAMFVDCAPSEGITALEQYLRSLPFDRATIFSQHFIVHLFGDRDLDHGSGLTKALYKTQSHLKTLYGLMHQFIRIEDDINRSGQGVFSPELRDDAQTARNSIFSTLSNIPGKSTYIALIELAKKQNRNWMHLYATNRAEQDADLPLWKIDQFLEFKFEQYFTPNTHKQLFELGLNHLIDIKDWLETGNDSLAHIYMRAENESEMRQIVTYHLKNKANFKYHCSEEQPLANEQRPDIFLSNPHVTSPVPIELKLLDKNWSGSKLCERLRNQLEGDYLREVTASCGIFMLVYQGQRNKKYWKIDNKNISLEQLADALENYWQRIEKQYPNVIKIKVIVIDLTKRKLKSET